MNLTRVRSAALLVGVAALSAQVALAHPPVSLVLDSRGNIYFSDLENVRILRPDGTVEIAVPGVHTHEMWLGPGDALHGEDVTNVGEAYRHRVWRLDPDGSVTDVISWRDGYPDDYHDYGFSRDAAGLTYILRRAERMIEVRDGDRDLVRTISLAGFDGDAHWLTVSNAGLVHVSVGPALLRIAPGETAPEVVVTGLVERTDGFDFIHDRHALMGMWSDPLGDVFVTVYTGQVLKRVSPVGEVTIVARSTGEWSPVGGTVGEDGALWILEWSSSNAVRVRRLDPDGSERIFASE